MREAQKVGAYIGMTVTVIDGDARIAASAPPEQFNFPHTKGTTLLMRLWPTICRSSGSRPSGRGLDVLWSSCVSRQRRRTSTDQAIFLTEPRGQVLDLPVTSIWVSNDLNMRRIMSLEQSKKV